MVSLHVTVNSLLEWCQWSPVLNWQIVRDTVSMKLSFMNCQLPVLHQLNMLPWWMLSRYTITMYLSLTSHQTQHSDPMLGQCWVDVVDGEPTLDQYRVDVSRVCWDGITADGTWNKIWFTSKLMTLKQCRMDVGPVPYFCKQMCHSPIFATFS